MPTFIDTFERPLSSELLNPYGLRPSDASVKTVSGGRYFQSRLRTHGRAFLALLPLPLLLVRANRTGGTPVVAICVAVLVVTVVILVTYAATMLVSGGQQLGLISVPPKARQLLGSASKPVREDAGGAPRYPLLATEHGIVLGPPARGGATVDATLFRELSATVAFEVTRKGRVASCRIIRDGEHADVSVRGRFALAGELSPTARMGGGLQNGSVYIPAVARGGDPATRTVWDWDENPRSRTGIVLTVVLIAAGVVVAFLALVSGGSANPSQQDIDEMLEQMRQQPPAALTGVETVQVSPTGRNLTITFNVSSVGCYSDHAAVVTETAQQVNVDVALKSELGGASRILMCGVGGERVVPVTLDEPLGDRQLIINSAPYDLD